MASTRRGFQIVELVIALVVVAGALLVIMTLADTNLRNARRMQDRAAARLMLLDLSDLLFGETAERLREMSGASSLLLKVLEDRIGRLPDTVRQQYRTQIAPLMPGLSCELVENEGGAAGIARLTVSVDLPGAHRVEVNRLFRPAARNLPDL